MNKWALVSGDGKEDFITEQCVLWNCHSRLKQRRDIQRQQEKHSKGNPYMALYTYTPHASNCRSHDFAKID